MTRRVLLVHGNTEWYGSDRSLTLLAKSLRDLGWHVRVAVPGEGPASAALRSAGISTIHYDPAPLRVRQYGIARLLRYAAVDLPRSVWRSRQVMRDTDIVHANTSILLGALIGARLARLPAILHVRESYAGKQRLLRVYAALLPHLATRIIAISNGIRDELAAAGLGDRAVVIHNGIEFRDVPPSRARTGTRVVAIGRINDWKGHDVLIEAIARLHDRGVVVPVDIAGDTFPGEEHIRTGLVELARRRGIEENVRFLGFVEDVDGLLDASALFVLPSSAPEPFGLALVDAMGRGLACIATDAGGPRDIVSDGRTGVLVPPRDPGALADAIERLWRDDDLRVRLGQAAASDVRARFSIGTTAKRVADLYDEILRERRAADSL